MKKVILLAVFMLAAASSFAQLKFRAGVTAAMYPYKSWTAMPMADFGLGYRWNSGVYLGGGLSLGAGISHRTERNEAGIEVSKTDACFLFPIYAEIAYIKPKHWYLDAKAGVDLYTGGGTVSGDLTLSVIPIGWTFDEHNSIGLGYRLTTIGLGTLHGISLSYSHTF